jgi:hypothetical protein
MDKQDEQKQAAAALATVQAHQDRAQRAARLPWWIYLALFVFGVAGTAINDFITVSGAKLIAVLVLIALAVVLVVGIVSRSAPLSRLRGVQPRQTFVPAAFVVVLFVGGIGIALISQYGNGFAHSLANAIGLDRYPNTVAGVIYAAAFTALFALSQLLIRNSQRRTGR